MTVFNKWREARLVGIAGMNASGKDTAALHLAREHGLLHVSTGDVLRAEADKRGLPRDRATLIEIAVELRAGYGSIGALVIKCVEQWQTQKDHYTGGLVINGIRVLGEAQEIKKLGGALCFIDAPIEERYTRAKQRARGNEAALSFEEFAGEEKIEYEGLGGPERPNLRAIQHIANSTIRNHRTPKLFIAQVDLALELSHTSES